MNILGNRENRTITKNCEIRIKSQEIDLLIEKTLRDYNSKIPGLAVGILHKNNLIYSQGFGFATISTKNAIDKDTIFRLASISKLFTTIAIMQLWEKGLFNLDDPVNKYLLVDSGHIRGKKDNWNEITFRHLLTHRSGIGELPRKSSVFKAPGFGLNVKWPKPIPPLKNLMKKDLKPDIPPDKKYAYCNFGFAILGYLIEIFSGKSYRDYIIEYILDPLEMAHSDFIRSERLGNKESTGYKIGLLSKKVKESIYWQGIIKSAGNLYSSINDMANFATMLLNSGSYKGHQILKPETLELCWTPHYLSHPALIDTHAIGLTFHIFNIDGKKVVQHTGLLNGHTSAFTLIPEMKLALMVFSNLGEVFYGDQTQRIKNLVLKYLLIDQKEKNSEIVFKHQTSKIKYDKQEISMITGIYGSYPGILTNIRVLMIGGEFYIKYKNNKLIFKSLYGPNRKPKILFPTEDPLVYKYMMYNGSYIKDYNKIAFTEDEDGNIIYMCWDLFQLPKKTFFKSLGCKSIFLLLLSLFAIILFF